MHRPPVADQGDLLFCSQPLCTEVEFQDRARYPHLYNADFFYDERHYNFEGATHYTRALAEKILESGVSP